MPCTLQYSVYIVSQCAWLSLSTIKERGPPLVKSVMAQIRDWDAWSKALLLVSKLTRSWQT